MNGIDEIRAKKMPYYLKAGFYIFLESERIRHLQDIQKIDSILDEVAHESELTEEVRTEYKNYAKRYVDFDF